MPDPTTPSSSQPSAPASAPASASVPASAPALSLVQRQARRHVRHHALGAAALGLIPLPLLDLLLITSVQVRMLGRVSARYEHATPPISLFAVLGSTVFSFLAFPILVSLLKFIPGLGTGTGLIAMPLLAGSLTYSLGMKHLEKCEAETTPHQT